LFIFLAGRCAEGAAQAAAGELFQIYSHWRRACKIKGKSLVLARQSSGRFRRYKRSKDFGSIRESLMSSSQADRLSSIPSATGGIVRLACARLREFGKDVGAILAQAGVTPEQAYDDSIRLEVPKQIRILNLAAEELGDELLGFHLGRNFDLREIGLLYYVIASSERLADAIRNAERYSRIMNDGVRLHFRQDDHTAAIALDYVNVDRNSDRHQIEFWLVTIMRICWQVTDSRLEPRHLRLRHRRDPTPSEFKTFLGTDVEFGASADEIVFPAPVASLPIVGRDNYLNILLRRYADEALAQRPWPREGFRSAVEKLLAQLLPHGKLSASEVAQRLGMSPRTLSRKLGGEGVTFADILDQLRSALAQRYLSEPELPISEIAWLLGYTEVSSFTHAFKRWTGKTPRQYRSEETPS
jgi:AraC-like DNA-binding protein